MTSSISLVLSSCFFLLLTRLLFFFVSVLLACTEPRFITPEHDYSKRPLQLFWVDGVALQAIAESDDPTLLMTQVVDDVVLDKDDPANEEEQQQQQQASGASSSSSLYPLQPPVSAVGDFKTTPMIHVGYATTWFGLSAAGVYMTRKLITKGRY